MILFLFNNENSKNEYCLLAWESSRHVATLPLVSSRNDVWETSAEIPYCWLVTSHMGNLFKPIRSTTQIWAVMRHQCGISALISQTSFGGETRSSITKCRLFSQADSLYNNLDSDSSPDHLRSSTSPLPLSHCSCSAGCSTKRCSCVRENIKCQDCRCGAPCKNPLNIMAEFGVDVDKATSDICLMQKLPKVCSMSGHWNSCIARITFIKIQQVDAFVGTICTTFFWHN